MLDNPLIFVDNKVMCLLDNPLIFVDNKVMC